MRPQSRWQHRRPGLHDAGVQLAAHRLGGGHRLVKSGQNGPGAIEQGFPRQGQLDMAGAAPQEFAPHEPLEHADLAAQRGLGQVETLARPAEVQLLGGGGEGS